ncbi:MAG: WecB/TagA/CpsF family glycosyltransferase [Oscillospiraceae bacterium]
MRTDVLGVGFDPVTMNMAVEKGISLCQSGKAAYVVTPNPEIVWESRKNAQLRDVLNSADLVLADGVGITFAAGILKTPLPEKVAGIDFAENLISRMEALGLRLYLFGGRPGIAEKAAYNLRAKYPKLIICGTHDGYFEDSAPIVSDINASGADAVFVCLGAPKQELWIAEHRCELNVHLLAGLGGSLDVFAGEVKRAPEKWRKMKLEWLYRLMKQPRRIKRMAKLPLYAFAVIGRRFGCRL